MVEVANHFAAATEQVRALGKLGSPEVKALNPVIVILIGCIQQAGSLHEKTPAHKHASRKPAGSHEPAAGGEGD